MDSTASSSSSRSHKLKAALRFAFSSPARQPHAAEAPKQASMASDRTIGTCCTGTAAARADHRPDYEARVRAALSK
ncbi:hypothetical protein H4R21_000549 [Coemansia helicoidea]|uniref:Uncharacterized protein n=1 Tax=Coemansia helicoidea TaxID=1286919 RepID=A0ACC1LES0_9FUNG|nr:hypothetical protein H4R21_000549 [Coemansia helicoidea]